MSPAARKPSSLLDTRVIYCGDNLEQLAQAPDRLRGPDLHRPAVQLQPQLRGLLGRDQGEARLRGPPRITQAYIDYMRPRCVELARVLKKTGSFYYHCDWHASHYVKVMLDQIFGENNFQNEIVWKRQTPTTTPSREPSTTAASTTQSSSTPGATDYTFNQHYKPYDQDLHRDSSTATSKPRRAGATTTATSPRPGARPRRRAMPTVYEFHWQSPAAIGGTAERTWRSCDKRRPDSSGPRRAWSCVQAVSR